MGGSPGFFDVDARLTELSAKDGAAFLRPRDAGEAHEILHRVLGLLRWANNSISGRVGIVTLIAARHTRAKHDLHPDRSRRHRGAARDHRLAQFHEGRRYSERRDHADAQKPRRGAVAHGRVGSTASRIAGNSRRLNLPTLASK